jgi:hypothetical protein
MDTTVLRLSMFAGLLALACADPSINEDSGETGEPIDRQLCDGSQDMRLAWAFGGGGGLITELQREGGFSYLYVRGDCHYWVLPFQKPPTIEVFETRTGVLSPDEAAALAELVSYGEWDGLTGIWQELGVYDVLIAVAHDGEQLVGCHGSCPDAPPQVQALASAANAEFLARWQAGASLDDAPIWVLAAEPLDPPNPNTFEIVPWTIALDLSTIAVDPEQLGERGVAARVDDPELAVALRAFRLEHAKPLSQYGDFFVEDDGHYFQLFLRDSIPFEDEQGLVALP